MTLASSSYLNQPLRSPEEIERQRQPRTMEEMRERRETVAKNKVVADCA